VAPGSLGDFDGFLCNDQEIWLIDVDTKTGVAYTYAYMSWSEWGRLLQDSELPRGSRKTHGIRSKTRIDQRKTIR
jgi:hypothetical protein